MKDKRYRETPGQEGQGNARTRGTGKDMPGQERGGKGHARTGEGQERTCQDRRGAGRDMPGQVRDRKGHARIEEGREGTCQDR